MTNVKPATDEQVADILGDLHQYHDYKMAECPFCAPIRARIDADREEIAANAHLIAEGIKVVNEQAAEIAALKAEVERMRLTVCRACVPTAAEPQPSGADGNASPPEGHGKKDFQITCGTGRAR